MLIASILLATVLPTVLASTIQQCSGTPYIRREWRELSSTDQSDFLSGLQILKSGSIPSKLGLSCRYDDYALLHSRYASTAHGNPKFLVWHRRFLADFEADLAIAIKRPFPLPYWQWTVDSQAPERSSLLTPLAFGTGGTGSNNCVSDGVSKGWQNNDNSCLSRGYGSGPISAFYSGEQVASVVQTTTTFDALWMGVEGGLHGTVHIAIGGDMSQMTSPRDPLFFLHHAYVDKMFYDWQNEDTSGARFLEYSVSGKLSDVMEPFTVQVGQAIDCRALCYTYSHGITPLQPNVSTSSLLASSSSAVPLGTSTPILLSTSTSMPLSTSTSTPLGASTSTSLSALTSTTHSVLSSTSALQTFIKTTATVVLMSLNVGNQSTKTLSTGNSTLLPSMTRGSTVIIVSTPTDTVSAPKSSVSTSQGAPSVPTSSKPVGSISTSFERTLTLTSTTQISPVASATVVPSKEYIVSPTDRSNQKYLRQPAPLPAAWCAMNNLNTDYIRACENELGQINYAVNHLVSTQNYIPQSCLQIAAVNLYVPATSYAEVPDSFVYPVNLTTSAANPANSSSPANPEYLAAVQSIAGTSRGTIVGMAGWSVLFIVISVLSM